MFCHLLPPSKNSYIKKSYGNNEHYNLLLIYVHPRMKTLYYISVREFVDPFNSIFEMAACRKLFGWRKYLTFL